MQAVQMHAFGEPEVLEVHELLVPSPAADEILIRVHAAAINPVDTSIRAGRATGLSGAALPYVPGFDVSGVVTRVGSSASAFNVGDEVFAMLSLRRGGGYAEYAIVKNHEAALKPESASHDEAASIPLVALTAWQALFDTANLQAGQTVLVHAGAGGVGSVAVQLAKWRGARIIATASDYNHDFLREIGVDVAVDYRTQRFEDFVDEVDVVLDPIGGDTQVRSIAILKEGGSLVSIVGLTPEGQNTQRNVNVTSILVEPNGEQLQHIADLIDEGHVQPIVSYRFPIDAAPQSHEQSQTRRTRGNIILNLD
ncbi:MAG: zinc-binding dehydrogenase [Pseudomonadales bacterium]|nr:zinc-binding dehydrogenase [Pseudomonadales bacterium]